MNPVAAVHRGAAAVVLDGDRRVLLVKSRRPPGFYGLPGGHIDDGEEPHDAAVREVSEETGLEARVSRLVGVYSFNYNDRQPYLVIYAFLCEIVSGTPVVRAPHEISEIGWFNARALPGLLENVAPHAIPDALEGKFGTVRANLAWKPI
jgi:8-oxo-dGTP pyrophosphatase MutT (NUDIX family)